MSLGLPPEANPCDSCSRGNGYEQTCDAWHEWHGRGVGADWAFLDQVEFDKKYGMDTASFTTDQVHAAFDLWLSHEGVR